MNIWLIKDGEPMPGFDQGARLMRMSFLGDHLSQQGHSVIWWCSTWSHYKKAKYIEKDHYYNVNPKFEIKMLDSCGYKKNISFSRIFHYSKLAGKFLKQAKKSLKPDLIICALPTVELSYVAVKYANKISCPILIDLRDMWPDILVMVFPKWLQPFVRMAAHYQFAMMKSLCRGASGFIGISEPYIEWAAKYAGRAVNDNDIVIPLVAPNTHLEFVNNTENIAQFFANKNVNFTNKFSMVFAGNYSKSTADLIPLIEAFKQLPAHFQLVIAGSAAGDKNLQTQYETLIKGITNIYLVGWLNAAQLNYLYCNSHVAVAPYINKEYFKMNLTNKPIEYLRYGLPILTSVNGYLSQMLVNKQVGYFYEDTNIKSIVDIVKKLDQDKDLYQSMRNNCKQLYEKEFDYGKVMENLSKHLSTKFHSFRV